MNAVPPSVPLPPPGIYPAVSFEEYLAWPAISHSSLQVARRSMAHYRGRRPTEETRSMQLGSLTHAGKFEPLTIPLRFVVMPDYQSVVKTTDGNVPKSPKATAEYKRLVNQFAQANSDKRIVSQSDYESMLGMVQALARHARASYFLTGGDHEVSIVAPDPVTGLPCKARLDHLRLSGPGCLVSELKTMSDACRCETVIALHGVHRQLAFYGDMLAWLGVVDRIDEYGLVIIESTGPHFGIKAAPLGESAIKAGRSEYRRLLNQIARCQESDVWPSYESPTEWNLPAWAVDSEPSECTGRTNNE